MMATQNVQTLSRVDVPETTREIVAPTGDPVPANVDAPYAVFVAFENADTSATLDVPDTKSAVSRTCHGNRAIMQDL